MIMMRVSEADREILERVLNVRRILNLKDVMQLLRSEIERAGSQRAFARNAGVNVSVVSKTLQVRYCLPKKFFARSILAWSICPSDRFFISLSDHRAQC